MNKKYQKTFNEKRLFNYHNNLNKQVEKNLFYQAKHRAKRDNLEFNIELSDIIIPSHCPILGIEIKPGTGRKPSPFSPSLDKIDSSKGYTKDNIMVISFKANQIKSNGTIEEHQKIINYMIKNQK